ncbi:hypothetical protein CB1_000875017 [Camelus ferus]|nr:hypothetical protein CB1_000875017 [Camelus ferus]
MDSEKRPPGPKVGEITCHLHRHRPGQQQWPSPPGTARKITVTPNYAKETHGQPLPLPLTALFQTTLGAVSEHGAEAHVPLKRSAQLASGALSFSHLERIQREEDWPRETGRPGYVDSPTLLQGPTPGNVEPSSKEKVDGDARRETRSPGPEPARRAKTPGPMAQKPIGTEAAERMNLVAQDEIW